MGVKLKFSNDITFDPLSILSEIYGISSFAKGYTISLVSERRISTLSPYLRLDLSIGLSTVNVPSPSLLQDFILYD